MNYVILGAGPAGVVAAETLRKADPKGSITLVGGEAEPPYSRMAIPYLLTGKIGEDGTYLRKADGHYDGLGIVYKQGPAKSVDAKGKSVTLADGSKLAYDKLLVATGSRPAMPPVDGMELKGVVNCWTMEDARKIAATAKKSADVVLIGAGFVGSIILESLALNGVNLTVIENEDRMLPKILDAEAGGILKSWVETKGVKVMNGTKVKGVSEKGGKLSVATSSGDVAADLVVVATGVKSNTECLEGSGVDIQWGVKVDNHLMSSVDGIYAAGDVANGPDFSGGHMVHPIQPTAVEHGRIAALNMAGQNATYSGSLIMNVLDTLGLVSASFGHFDDGQEAAVQSDPANYRYTKLVFDGDRLAGAITLGRTDQIGAIGGLVKTKAKLGAWKARLQKDPNLVVDAFVACTQG